MKWIEEHWILTIVIVVAVIYLYNAYGQNLLSGGASSSTGASLNS